MRSENRTGNGYLRTRLYGLFAVGVLLVACQPTAAPTPEPPTPEPPTPTAIPEFRSPGPSPVGLAWDGSHLWVVDAETRLVYPVDPATGEPVRELRIEAERPQSAAWDGESLWVLDEGADLILRLDPETGETTGSIRAPRPEIEGDWSYTGMTFDGQFLWVAISAGWCSSLNRIHPESGEIAVSFFPQCNPRGLASDDEHLWTIAYNGERLPSRLDQRLLSDKIAEMAQSQDFLFDLRVTDPTALAYGDGVLWMADRAEGRILQIKAR